MDSEKIFILRDFAIDQYYGHEDFVQSRICIEIDNNIMLPHAATHLSQWEHAHTVTHIRAYINIDQLIAIVAKLLHFFTVDASPYELWCTRFSYIHILQSFPAFCTLFLFRFLLKYSIELTKSKRKSNEKIIGLNEYHR